MASRADGEYLAFLDDDMLPRYALHYAAEALQHCDADLLYSDEDRLDGAGRRVEPVFKPAWSPGLLLSCMYAGHFLVVRRGSFEVTGGFRSSRDSSQDHDFLLRLADGPVNVRHIPRERGYEVIYEPAAVLRHDEGHTRPPGVRWMERILWAHRRPDLCHRVDSYYSPHLTTGREDAPSG